MRYFKKFYGENANTVKSPDISEVIFAWIGGFIAISIIGYFTMSYNLLFVMGSFGASCVLLFAYPKSPFSQPKNLILGHLFSTFIGLCFLHIIGDAWWSMALALATSISVMLITSTVHPPAGSNPLIVFLLNADFDYLLFPSFSGAAILLFVAVLYINLHPKKVYPQYWY